MTKRLSIFLGVAALVAGLLPALPASAQTEPPPPDDSFTCRASVLRTEDFPVEPLNQELIVANEENDAGAACRTETGGLNQVVPLLPNEAPFNGEAFQIPVGNLGTLRVLFAETKTQPDGEPAARRAEAASGVAQVRLQNVPVIGTLDVDVLTSQAAVTCPNEQMTSSSRVVSARVGGTEVVPNAPLGIHDTNRVVVDQGGVKLTLNEETPEPNKLTRRALHLETPAGDVIIAEAIVDFHGDPCQDTTPGGGGGGGELPECSDGIDNDGDGKIDHPADPGCDNPNDDNETDDGGGGGEAPECRDGVDNDGDGKIDHPADPGCDNPNDDDEADDDGGGDVPECRDGVDNDGDGRSDYPNDPGCQNPDDDDERDNGDNGSPGDGDAPECSDEVDNDGDGVIDYNNDPGCESPWDDNEADGGDEAPECSNGDDDDGDDRADWPDDPGCENRNDDNEEDNDNPECSDGVDNEPDGSTDAGDSGCVGDDGTYDPNDDDEADGFITAGGWYTELDKRYPPEDEVEPGDTLHFTLHSPCDIGDKPTGSYNLTARWHVTDQDGEGNGQLVRYDLEVLTRAFCRNDPLVDSENPGSEFDTFVGEGTGDLKLGDGTVLENVQAKFIAQDRGEPGGGGQQGQGIDYFEIRVVSLPPVCSGALYGCGTLDGGNIQTHSPAGQTKPIGSMR
ncbi:MAG: hypothetical protein M3N53_00315 [Actinomycetota bacterium]|nr:hypothetical protein [Actinomycetota bacterium]